MKVVILAGGYGTRLSEETATIPKPMIEIGGRPLLWHLMKLVSARGFNEFIVALGYKGHVIKKYFLEYPRLQSDLHIDIASGAVNADRTSHEDWTVDLVDTGTASMTGGRLKRLRHLLNDTFILTYGDGLSNIPIDRLVEFHRCHGRLATVTAVRPPSRFGVLRLEGERVTTFNEKTDYPGTLINGGYFVLEPEVIDYIEGDQTVWERAPCERLASEGQLMAYRHDGYWQCVDTLHELRLLRETWDGGGAPWKVW
ncbi:MAG: glucose-1-phosphate cytidylyltransferase [Gammaproteobacteria bacterium]|nr:glucose-1-phosphate cytidylyltransferase [Gammaproteobacteria bacterium]